MSTKEFNERVIHLFTDEITDIIFQYVLDNDELMCYYLDLISEHGRKTVNSQLGKAIKVRFDIDNINDDGNVQKGDPKCVLIKTEYTKHKLR
jgi:hypothetical protein